MRPIILGLLIACWVAATPAQAQPPVKTGGGWAFTCKNGAPVYDGSGTAPDAGGSCRSSAGASSSAAQGQLLQGAFDAGVALNQLFARADQRARERRAAREAARIAAEVARRDQFVRDSIAAARAREETWRRLSSQFQFSTAPQLEMRLGSPAAEIGFRFDGDPGQRELSNRELMARDATSCTFMACGEKTAMPELGDPMVVDLRHLRRATHLLRQTLYAPAEERESALDVATQIIEGHGPEFDVPPGTPDVPREAAREMGAAVGERRTATAERMRHAAAVDTVSRRREFLIDVVEFARSDPTLSDGERARILEELGRQLSTFDSALAQARLAYQRAQENEDRARSLERSTLLRFARGQPRPPQLNTDAGVVDLSAMSDRALVVNSEVTRDTTKSGLRIMEPPAPEPRSTRTYTPMGSGLVGGTGWIVGYNVPDGPEGARIRAEADAALQKLQQAGTGPLVDPSEYRFILGVAASHNEVRDLATRVFFDNLRNGRTSAENQALYASLTGRQFDNLDCHSNGAMVCLAAIENADIRARHVRLFGPQITPESAAMWNSLVENGDVASVTVYASPADFVPKLSYALGALTEGPTEALNLVWGVESALRQKAPRLSFVAPECAARYLVSVHCHSMSTYQEALRREPATP